MSNKHYNVTQVAASTPFDNSTNGFAATDVQAAIEEAKNTSPYYYVSDTSTTTTTSTTYANLTGMTVTPPAGTYLVTFNGHSSLSGVNGDGYFAIAIANTVVADSVRELACSTAILGLITLSTNAITAPVTCCTRVVVNGSQAVTAQFRSVAGTITCAEKTLTLLRVA